MPDRAGLDDVLGLGGRHVPPPAPTGVLPDRMPGQNAFREELLDRGICNIPVCTIVTQVEVDPADPAFENPAKPIGKFMTEEEARAA